MAITKSLSLLIPLLLCFTSTLATLPMDPFYDPAACGVCPSMAMISPCPAISPFCTPRWSSPYIYNPIAAIPPYHYAAQAMVLNAPLNQLPSGQVFSQLQSNQLFNQQQANQLFQQQQANQVFSQLGANQLFNLLQSNQVFNQQQANQLLFQNQQVNQAFNQLEANQLQTNQACNQQQANKLLFLKAQLGMQLRQPPQFSRVGNPATRTNIVV